MQEFLKGGSIIISREAREKNLEATLTFSLKPRPFSIVVARNSLLYLSIDPFLMQRLARVSLSHTFLSSSTRKGVPFSLSSVLVSD